MERILKEVKKNPSLWKAIRLRFLTVIAAFGTMYILTGSPIQSVGLTAAQQSVSFGVHYIWEINESQETKKKGSGFFNKIINKTKIKDDYISDEENEAFN